MDASTGHNSRDLTPGELRALTFDHAEKIKQATDKWKAANETRKMLRKDAKRAGIASGDIDFILRWWDAEDENVIVDELKRRNRLAGWLAMPLGVQADLDFDEPDREPAEDLAYREGMAANYAGEFGHSNPYGAGSPPHQRWAEGWSDGQKQRLADLQSAMEKNRAKAEAAGAKPGKKAEEAVH